jgi:hypothetical protein
MSDGMRSFPLNYIPDIVEELSTMQRELLSTGITMRVRLRNGEYRDATPEEAAAFMALLQCPAGERIRIKAASDFERPSIKGSVWEVRVRDAD